MGYPLRLLARLMTHAEFLGWVDEFLREPFDDRRCFDLPAALIQSLLANIHRGEGQKAHRFDLFMPFAEAWRQPAPESEEDIDALVMSKL